MRGRSDDERHSRLLGAGLIVMLLTAPSSAPAGSHPARQEASPVESAAASLTVSGDQIAYLVLPGAGDETLFVVGERGLYRSGDGGVAWHRAGPRPPAARLALSADAAVILAGSRSACGRGEGNRFPLFRSTDGGASWQPVPGVSDLLPLAVWREPRLAVGATCAGLQVSHDDGLTWQPAAFPPDYDISASAPAPGPEETPALFVIGTSEGGTSVLSLLRFDSQGELAAVTPLHTFWGAGAIGGSRARPVLGTAQGVLVSDDGGITWRHSRFGLEPVTLSVDPSLGPIPDDELARGFGITAIAADPDRPDTIYAGTVAGVYYSRDGGAAWAPLAGVSGIVTALILTPRGTLLAQTNTGVVELAVTSAATPVAAATPLPPAASLPFEFAA